MGTEPTTEQLIAKIDTRQRQQKIIVELLKERDHQDDKWGGASHDDNDESTGSFVNYICEYATGVTDRAARHDVRTRLIKAAALAVAAVESLDRKAERSSEDNDRS